MSKIKARRKLSNVNDWNKDRLIGICVQEIYRKKQINDYTEFSVRDLIGTEYNMVVGSEFVKLVDSDILPVVKLNTKRSESNRYRLK